MFFKSPLSEGFTFFITFEVTAPKSVLCHEKPAITFGYTLY